MIVKLQNSRRFVSSCTRGDEQQQERHEAAGAREEAQQQPEVADLVRQEAGQRGREDEEDGDDGIHDGSLLYGHTWDMIWAMERCLRLPLQQFTPTERLHVEVDVRIQDCHRG